MKAVRSVVRNASLVRTLLSVAALSLPMLAGCRTSPAVASSSSSLTASSAKCGAARVVPVEGRIAHVDGRTVAQIDPLPSTEPPRLGAPVELYIQTFPTEEFDAHVTGVSFGESGSVTLEASTVRNEARLADGTPFSGDLILTDTCPSHRESSLRMHALLGEI
jgi:hypothetical protein